MRGASRTAEIRPIIWITERHPPDAGGMAVSSGRLVDSLRDLRRRVTTLHLRAGAADRFELSGDDLNWTCTGWQGDAERLFFLNRREMEGKILVGFGGWSAGYFASLWAKWLGSPSLVLFRGNDLDRLLHDPLRGWMVHTTLQLATLAGGVSTEMCARLAALRTGPVVFTPIGIDPQEWASFPGDHAAALDLRRRHSPDGRPIVGMFGQLKGKKGLATAMTVFREYGLGKLARLLTVGDLPQDARKDLSESCASCWSHEPFRSRDDLLPLYLACDIVLIPSINDGMPNVLLEAMLCGKVVVASSAGGIPDVVLDGTDAFLFPAGDAVAACEVLAEVLSFSPERLGEIGERARRKALEFHREREAEIIDRALLSLTQEDGHLRSQSPTCSLEQPNGL